jgi:hypothetical protein
LVFAIDQGEELFAAEGREDAEYFLSVLAHLLSPESGPDSDMHATRLPTLVIVAIRSDSYERLQTEAKLQPITTQLFSLPPIARAEYKHAIEGPAARHTAAGRKLIIEPALTERLLDDTEGADALPLLSFTLERLFAEHGGDGDLRLEEYELLGGVRGSIDSAVEVAFAEPKRDPVISANKEEREAVLRRAFIPWLARVEMQTEERKRRVAAWNEIPVEARPLLERMI